MTAAAFQACFTDWRLIKGRKVVQVVFEVPIEAADQAYQALGGMPNPAESVWCGVARLNLDAGLPIAEDVRGILKQPDAGVAPSPAGEAGAQTEKADAPVSRPLSQKIGALCANGRFQAFLKHAYPREWAAAEYLFQPINIAAEVVRGHCGEPGRPLKSRSDIIPTTPAAGKWAEMEWNYVIWMRAPGIVG